MDDQPRQAISYRLFASLLIGCLFVQTAATWSYSIGSSNLTEVSSQNVQKNHFVINRVWSGHSANPQNTRCVNGVGPKAPIVELLGSLPLPEDRNLSVEIREDWSNKLWVVTDTKGIFSISEGGLVEHDLPFSHFWTLSCFAHPNGSLLIRSWGQARFIRLQLSGNYSFTPEFKPYGGLTAFRDDGSFLVTNNYFAYSCGNDNELQWSIEHSDDDAKSLGILSDGEVVISSDNGNLLCISKTGDVIWKTNIYKFGESKYNAEVFHGCQEKIEHNAENWLLYVSSFPVISDGDNIFIKDNGGLLWKMNKLGELMWVFPEVIGDANFSFALSMVSDVIITGENGTVQCIGSDGIEKWRVNLPGSELSPPCIDFEGNIFISSYGDIGLYCLDSSGSVIWELEFDFQMGTPAVLTGLGCLVFVAQDEKVYSIHD